MAMEPLSSLLLETMILQLYNILIMEQGKLQKK